MIFKTTKTKAYFINKKVVGVFDSVENVTNFAPKDRFLKGEYNHIEIYKKALKHYNKFNNQISKTKNKTK